MLPGVIPDEILRELGLLDEYRKNSTLYSTEPTAYLAFERFRPDQILWKKTGAKSISIRKPLIITDWSFSITSPPFNDRPDLNVLKCLLAAGQPIFICRDGKLIKIEDSLHLDYAVKTLKPVHPDEVMTAVEEYNKQQTANMQPGLGAVEIMDYFRQRKLLKDVQRYPDYFPNCKLYAQKHLHEEMSFTYFLQMTADFFEQVLKSLMGHSSIKINFSNARKPLRIKKFLERLSSQIDQISYQIAGTWFNELLQQQPGLFNNLKSACIWPEHFDEQNFLVMMPYIAQLLELKFANVAWDPAMLAQFQSPSKLKNISFVNAYSPPFEELCKFFKLCPDLKELSFEFPDLSLDPSKQFIPAPSIEKLILNEGTMPTSLASLYPNLQELDLHCIAVVGVLPKLKKLRTANIKFSEGQWIDILNQCPQLETIEINWSYNFINIASLARLNICQNVRFLSLVTCVLSHEELALLTSKFPNLNKLSLKNCTLTHEKISSPQPPQFQLKHLNIEDKSYLSELTRLYPGLTEITVNEKIDEKAANDDSAELPKLSPLSSLPNLQNLEANFLAELPINLLSPSLQKLKIYKEIEEKVELPLYHRLTDLSVMDNLKRLADFINHCPSLVKLHINKNKISSMNDLSPLSNLEALILENCEYEGVGFENLLAKMPHLKTLILKDLCVSTKNLKNILASFELTYGELTLKKNGDNIIINTSAKLFSKNNPILLKSFCYQASELLKKDVELLLDNVSYDVELLLLEGDKELFMYPENDALDRLIDHSPSLRQIGIKNVGFKRDYWFKSRVNNRIEEISFENCYITKDQIISLLEHYPIKFLHIEQCQSLSKADITDLQRRYPEVKIDHRPIISDEDFKDEEVEELKQSSDKKQNHNSGDEKSSSVDQNSQLQAIDNFIYDPDAKPPTHYDVQQFYLQDEKKIPDVSIYRKSFFNDYKLTPKGIAFVPVQPEVKVIPAARIPFVAKLKKKYDEKGFREARCSDSKEFKTSPYYGRGQFTLTQQWQPLPGLSTEDVLIGFESSLTPPAIEVGICQETRRYYMRLAKGYAPQPVTIAVIMQATWRYYSQPGKAPTKLEFELDEQNRLKIILPKELSLPDLVAFCRQVNFSPSYFEFKVKKLSEPTAEEQVIQKLLENLCKSAACGDRVTLFILVARALQFNFRINNNALHTFPELEVNGKWEIADLGGVAVVVNEALVPDKKIAPQKPTFLAAQLPAEIYYSKKLPLTKEECLDAKSYCQKILAVLENYPNKKNIQLNFNSAEDILRFKTAMGKTLLAKGQRYHYLPGFENFSKTTLVPKADADPEKIPHETIQFLLDAKPGDVLFVDWSDYEAEHLAFNTMLDPIRHIKGVPIPEGVIVIVLMEKDKGKNLREDFNSRLRFIDDLPNELPLPEDIFNGRLMERSEVTPKLEQKRAPKENTAGDTKSELPENVIVVVGSNAAEAAIFYTEENWQQELLGIPKMVGKHLILEEGPLLRALRLKQKNITFINAPWHLKSFRLFISEALVQGKFNYYGIHEIPNDFLIQHMKRDFSFDGNYSVESLNDKNNDEWNYVLNSESFDSFFEIFCIENNGFDFPGGWLKEQPGAEKVILVTNNLSKGKLAKLCAKIKELGIVVRFVVTHNVELPAEMDKRIIRPDPILISLGQQIEKHNSDEKAAPVMGQRIAKVAVYTTNDIDFKAQQLAAEYKTNNIFSVGETTNYRDLFDPILVNETVVEKKKTRTFTALPSCILDKLMTNEKVILKGRFSNELLMNLQSLLAAKPYLMINGKRTFVSGELILVTDQKTVFSFTSKPPHTSFTVKDYWPILQKQFKSETCTKINEKLADTQPNFIQLQNQLRLQELPPLLEDKKLDETERRALLLAQLIQNNLGTIILGDTGTGKSFTLFEDLPRVYGKKVNSFVGMTQLYNWAKASDDGEAILVIDESTLEDDDFSVLEGLWSDPKGIVIKGEFCKLADHHRVVFAGNYTHYAGRRHHRIFDYCVATVFQPLSVETLTKKTNELLIKILPSDCSAMDCGEVTKIFLLVYEICRNKVAALQNEKQDFSPPLTLRNLHTMALQFAVLVKRHHKDQRFTLSKLAWMVAYDQIRNLFNKETKAVIKKEILQHLTDYKSYKAALAEFACDEEKKKSNFVITQKRRSPLRLLTNQLAVRELRIKHGLSMAGSRGILLEGPAGSGKSSLAVECLKRLNYQDVTEEVFKEAGIELPTKSVEQKEQKTASETLAAAVSNTPTDLEQNTVPIKTEAPCKFVRITPADPEELKAVLQIAFHKGYGVEIGELNRLPCENILNYFLSGRDLAGKKPDQEGFFVIATQNSSATTPGCQPLSAALLNRFEQINIPQYEDQELVQLVTPHPYFKGDTKRIANSILGYKSALWASEVRKTLKPTPRDLSDQPEIFEEIARHLPVAVAA